MNIVEVTEGGVTTRDATEAELLEFEQQGQEQSEQVNARALSSYMHEFRDMRRELLNVLIGIAMAEDMLDEFKAARESLLNIPQLPAVENATTAAEAKAACKAAYLAVVAAAPPQFILAFKELNG